jgi:predicted Fe-Mo cluster-binding NifX family protein
MKIALPSNQNQVDGHFGHCQNYTIFTLNEKKEITGQEVITPPAGCGCKSNIVQILSQKGVTVMLAGNIGQGAVDVLNSYGIEVLRGCFGDVNEVVKNWINGSLTDSGTTCSQHQHGCHE